MPNWVTNKVQAPSHVIRAMLNAEGRVDFNVAAPFPGSYGKDWDGVYSDAKEAAEIVCRVQVDDHLIIAMLQSTNRQRFDIKKLSEESFEQFVGMIRNWRACGYLDPMDFNRKVWGTEWNACEPSADTENGKCSFETAWACPEGVLVKLSERFPDDEIVVTYADEDIGSNCGTFTLKAGVAVKVDIAPAWRDMSGAEKAKWKAFAYEVKGWEPDEED